MLGGVGVCAPAQDPELLELIRQLVEHERPLARHLLLGHRFDGTNRLATHRGPRVTGSPA